LYAIFQADDIVTRSPGSVKDEYGRKIGLA